MATSPKAWVSIQDMPGIKYLFGLIFVEAIGKMYAIGGNSNDVYVYSTATGWKTSSKSLLL